MNKALIAMLLVLAVCTAAAANEVVNGDFETGDFTGWSQNGTGATFAITPAGPQAGSYAAELTAADGSLASLTQMVNVQPNTQYYLSMWVKTSGAPSALDCHLDAYDSEGNYQGYSPNFSVPASSHPAWTRYTKLITTSATTTRLFWYNAMNLAPGVSVTFDSFSCEEIAPGSGLVTNPGFELGDVTGWNTAGSGNTFTVVTDQPHRGSYALACVGVTGTLCDLTQKITVKPSTTYYVTVWVRTIGIPVAFDTHFDEYRADDSYASKSEYIFGGTWGSPVANWIRLSKTFTTGPQTAYMWWWNRMNVPAGVTIFLDDLNVVEMPPQDGLLINPGFELGDVIGWSTFGNGMDFDVTTDNPHSGTYAAMLTGTNWELSGMNQTFPLEPNTDYVASVWYRSTGAWENNAEDNKILELDASGAYVVGSDIHSLGIPASAVENWTQGTVMFRTTPDTRMGLWNQQANIHQGDRLFLDDYSIRKVEYKNYGSLGAMKADGALSFGAVTGMVVTRATDGMQFWVESQDRSSGILVECPDYPYPGFPNEGDVVDLKGVLKPALNTGEFHQMLTLQCTEQPVITGSIAPLEPLGSIQRPILSKIGLSMEGLLVKVFGQVASADEVNGFFWISDGSGNYIRVATSYDYPFPQDGQYVAVTGNVASENGNPFISVLLFGQVERLAP